MATGFSVASEADSADLIRLWVDVPPDEIEIARASLIDMAGAGWSESHATSGALRIEAWVARRARAEIIQLQDALRAAGLDVHVNQVAQDTDWQDGLRRHHQPIEVRGKIRVRPPWVAVCDGPIDIEIDPGMAFGTGQHATTRGCLDLMLDLPPGSLIDVGAGSGVLAIAAVKLGHDPVMALDNDPLATEATERNAAVNGVALAVELAEADARVLPSADVVVANITRLHVAALAGNLAADPPKHAVLSGFVVDDVQSATAPWIERGYRQVATFTEDGWAAVRLDRG
jgi:ribosomal protein L11 methyltransferase